MKQFAAQPGVMLLDICGEAILTATGDARGKCPDVTHINASGAVLWKLILEEKTIDRAALRAQQELSLSQTDAFRSTLVFISKLVSMGYLVQVDAI